MQWEQQFTAAAGVSWSPNSKWLFSTRANFRTGRPYTPVDSFVPNATNDAWLPVFGRTDGERYPFFLELNLRGERRFQWGPLSCAVYVEVLNVTNTMNLFSWVYGEGDFANGVQPNQGRFTHEKVVDAIVSTSPSRCHVSPATDSLRRAWLANPCPSFSAQ